MATPIYTSNMRVQNAKTFLSSLGRTTPEPDSLYIFMGRTTAWTDDNNPPAPTDTATEERDTRNDIVGVKRIYESDASLVIPRYDWTSGTIYDQYSEADETLYTKEFYVVNSSFNVYKCISNNLGVASTVEPTGTSTSEITTGDGYVWKFMYDIPTSEATKFMTDDFMPVPIDSRKSALQIAVETAASDATDEPIGGHGFDAASELYAFRLMAVGEFDADEGGVLPTNIDYRQVGYLVNIEETGGDIATSTVYVASSLNLLTGQFLYVENREPINRSASQTEKFPTVLTF